jgi:hypothetical protein
MFVATVENGPYSREERAVQLHGIVMGGHQRRERLFDLLDLGRRVG